MPRTRQTNVTAAQWSANGAALGALDLTIPDNQVFGANVFSPAVQRARLPKHVYKALHRTLARGEALDTTLADSVAQAGTAFAVAARDAAVATKERRLMPMLCLTRKKRTACAVPR